MHNGAHREGDETWRRRRFDLVPTNDFGQEDKGGLVRVVCDPW
jgi:hypothetical protein